MTAFEVIDRLTELGCAVRVEGERLKVRGPNLPEVPPLVSQLRARRHEAIFVLREQQSKPPSPEEVTAMLPPGVRVRGYEPKASPFDVAPVYAVTNAGKFFRSYLLDLARRLAHPDTYAAPPLTDILAKLADVGLDLELTEALPL